MIKLAPYLAYAKKCFLGRSAYRFDHLMNILSTCLQIFIFWGIYHALYGENTEVDGITLPMVATNFVLSMGLGAVFSTNDYFFPDKIHDGSIATELLRPISVPGRMIAENAGNALFNLIFRFTPALVLSILIIGISAPAGVGMFILFLISVLLGYGVLWAISFSVQMTAFWFVNVWSITTIKNVFINVLSGSMIPLWFMPGWMKGVLYLTPFSSIYFTPVQIYLGQLTYQEIALKCAVQGMWIILIYLAGDFLWKKGQKKLVVQGG
ncbi:MAG: ABC-2 family transporter protein [Lachnospiraceae bacterium]|nr:ABC-2 family transporter protein [Lachnospiraceae bacterium]